MEKNTAQKKNKLTSRAIVLFASVLFLLAAISATSVLAWFYLNRGGAGIKKITNPTAIFIRAGNAEPIVNLDLSAINVQQEDNYSDYVFCVTGVADAYKLQLAYTTNNQFEYELYHASHTDDPDYPALATAEAKVEYNTHPETPPASTIYYYVPSGATAIAGTELNRDTGAADIRALQGTNKLYKLTYTPADTSTVYDHHHDYAIPIYWQSNDAISTEDAETGADESFLQYYILRIKWTGTRANDKETDIIYISAKSVSVSGGGSGTP